MSPLQLLFLGTGTSSGLPLAPCLTLSEPWPWSIAQTIPTSSAKSPPKGGFDPNGSWPSNIPCACCRSAVHRDVPEGWKNRRGNTSVVVRKKDKKGQWRNIVVDVGKTFREQATRFFPRWGVKTVDAVILTHGHADAYFGLDDLREWCTRQGKPIPIYLNRATYEIVANSFPYLVDKSAASGGGDIPTLQWNIIENEASFEVFDIHVQALPTHHGVYFRSPPETALPTAGSASTKVPPVKPVPEPLICLGYMFDREIVYISDVSFIPETTWDLITNRYDVRRDDNAKHDNVSDLIDGVKRLTSHSKAILPTPGMTPTRPRTPSSDFIPVQSVPSSFNRRSSSGGRLPILIIDALFPIRTHSSHFNLAQALDAAMRLDAEITYFVGSSHPTSHYMWQEICRSFRGEDGQRKDHPDNDQCKTLLRNLMADEQFSGTQDGKESFAQKLIHWGGRAEPAWDGLVVQVGAKDGGFQELENESAGGWGI
ncbi:beta-lactamase-like protein [Naematelia encephala]|uniref:Beta-lactamase-like protein n=1 Tax=Naematelia encephala TaxID=71784 RepID=A0A1Y2AY27_9TREE|nr:beta-lactamase-like protein [Naematelia encephala]